MSRAQFILVCAAVGALMIPQAASADAPPGPLDGGGTSFPYPPAPQVQAAGGNLAPDGSFEQMELGDRPPGWFKSFRVYAGDLDKAKAAEIRARVQPSVEIHIAAGRAHSGQRSLFLHVPADRWKEGDLAFASRVTGRVPLGGALANFAVRFAYRFHAEPPAPGHGRVEIEFLDADGNAVRPSQHLRLRASPDWVQRTAAFRLDKAATQLEITFYLDNCGTAEYDDLEIFPIAEGEKGISIRCVPMQFLDGVFALSQGDVSLMRFGCKSDEPKPAAYDAHVLFALPAGVQFISWQDGLKLVARRSTGEGRSGGTVYDFAAADFVSQFVGREHDEKRMALLATTDLPAGAAAGSMQYWVEYAPAPGRERTRTTPAELKLMVLPPIRARTPADFAVGAMLRRPSAQLGDSPAVRQYAQFIQRCGVNWLPGTAGSGAGRCGHELGLVVTSEQGPSNGYSVPGEHPPQWSFIRADGNAVGGALCPAVIYQRLPYYLDHVCEGVFRKALALDRTADGFNANWEPYTYLDRGCFCPRCKKEFIAFSHLTDAQVDALWPLGVLKEYRDLWNGFSSYQHGRVLATLDEDCRKVGAQRGPGFFIPEVSPAVFDSVPNRDASHANPQDYASQLTHLASWGGYCSFDYLAPDIRPGLEDRLNLLVSARRMRSWIDANCPPDHRPRLHWCFQGFRDGRYVTFPEAITFDLLTCYVAGLDGAWAYVFPNGYDNRYWQALARGADAAAALAPYVRQGQPLLGQAPEAITPVPTTAQGSLLRSFEFRSAAGRLVAVGNFWLDSEIFFRLRPGELSDGGKYLLIEPLERRQYASPAGQPYWTADELKAGATLHVGALRWAFFEIKPYEPGADWPSLTQEEITRALGQRRGQIDAAYAEAMRTGG